jgi:hypothetical protein
LKRSIDNRWKLDLEVQIKQQCSKYLAPETMFAQMIAVDVLVANLWMGFLLYGTQKKDRIDKWLKADNTKL